MKSKKLITLMFLLPLTSAFYGCATTESKTSPPDETSRTNSSASIKTEKKASSEDYGKAARKISQAIGEEIENFKITSRTEGDSAPAGFSEGIYTVLTNSGVKYKCSVLEPSGFMNAMSFGGAGSAGAMCTNFTKGSKDKGKTNKASCNDLLRAAGKC